VIYDITKSPAAVGQHANLPKLNHGKLNAPYIWRAQFLPKAASREPVRL